VEDQRTRTKPKSNNRSQEDWSEEQSMGQSIYNSTPASINTSSTTNVSHGGLPPLTSTTQPNQPIYIPPPPERPPPVLTRRPTALKESTNENETQSELDESIAEPELFMKKQEAGTQFRTPRSMAAQKWNILPPNSPRNEKLGMLRYDSRPKLDRAVYIQPRPENNPSNPNTNN